MRLRTILLVLVGIVVLAVAAVIIVLLSTDFGKYKGLIAERVEQATGRKFTIGGELKLVFLPSPALSVKDVAFANAAGGSRPDMAKLGILSAEVKLLPLLSGTVSVSRLVLENVDLLLETDAKGRPNWAFDTAAPAPTTIAAPGGGALQLPDFDNVSLKNVVVTYRDGATQKTLTASLKELTTTASSGGSMKVTAAADYQGLPVTVDATLGALAILMRPGTPYPVEATITAAGATVKLTGSAADPVRGRGLDFTVAVDGQNLGTLTAVTGTPLPAKPYHLAATISGDADKAVTAKALQATLGTISVSGDAGVVLGGARPKLSGNLAVALLDTSEFPPAKAAPAPRSGDADRMFSADPLPLDALRAFDADLTLRIGTIKAENLTLQNLSLHLTLDDRALQVKPFAVEVGGSRLNAAVDLSGRQAPAALTFELDGKQVDVGKLLLQASGNDLLDAKGDINVAVRGSGDSLHAIMASLNGQSSLVIGKGTIKSRYADLIGADVFREAFAWAKGKHDTTLNCMVSRFDIKNGLATSTGILMDTSDVSIAGEGTINLGTERLDLTLKPRPKETSLLSLAIPLDVTGTLKHPSVLPDKVAVAKEVAVGIATSINPLVAVGAFVLNNTGGDDNNPCVAALEQKGGKAPPAKEQGGVSGAVNGVGRSINNLFK
jgi:uncharacterized protein involved in outer membrane biogenesis